VKFAVLQFFAWPERRVALPIVYERALDRIEVMDRSGYDAVWLAEHHFTGYSVCPSVHLMAMHVADRTQNLRIGTGVSLAAFYHPLRLAEEVAMLDVLTGGRINWGAGRGFDPLEFKTFGVPIDESYERFQEAVDIVRAAWTQDRLTWSGRYWNFEGVEVLPKPLQKPHPPSWVAATSPRAMRWAAERGYDIMLDPHSHWRTIAEKVEFYRRELESHGRSSEGREIPVVRLIAVADTDREAQDVARAGAAWMAGSYLNPTKAAGLSEGGVGTSGGDLVERYLDGIAIHGCPERVIDELQMLREEMPLEYCMCAPIGHSSFMMFTEKVLPHLL
jgi:alkanesulfonate monooxygenase SsuD/methylene tetrahydromethanopterin reductase-like flavin-dependent oxidoreductase (luciferase family)